MKSYESTSLYNGNIILSDVNRDSISSASILLLASRDYRLDAVTSRDSQNHEQVPLLNKQAWALIRPRIAGCPVIISV